MAFFEMNKTVIRPNGHKTMVILGFIVEGLCLLIFLLSGLASLETNIFENYGEIYVTSFFIFFPIICLAYIYGLIKIANKEIIGIKVVKISLIFSIIISLLVLNELVIKDQNDEIFLWMFTICIDFGFFLYWNNRNHINYFRSIKNNQYY